MGKGLKWYIRKNIPKIWEQVLLEEKCIGRYVNYVYNGSVRNNVDLPKSTIKRANLKRINHALNGRFIHSINFMDLRLVSGKDGYTFWLQIIDKINKKEDSCR